MEMMAPNTQALIMEVIRSQAVMALTQEFRMITAGTSYTISAIIMLHPMPARQSRTSSRHHWEAARADGRSEVHPVDQGEAPKDSLSADRWCQ